MIESALMVKRLVLFLLIAFPASADPQVRSPIERALSALPASSFDNTTDGLSPDDLRRLIASGDTEDWTLKKTGPATAVVTAKHPFSEVSINVRSVRRKDYVIVKTQNEQATTVEYFEFGRGGALRRFHPSHKIKDAIENLDP